MRTKRVLAGVVLSIMILSAVTGFLYRLPGIGEITVAAEAGSSAGASPEDETGWETVKEGKIVLESSSVRFEMDAGTTTFTVTDKKSGREYPSNPADDPAFTSLSEEMRTRMFSPLSITFYDAKSKKNVMGAIPDSVEKGRYEVKKKDDRIRIYYTLGESRDSILVPKAFTVDTFENRIMANAASDKAKRRLRKYYLKYSKNDTLSKEEMSKLLQECPYLEKEDLYILAGDPDKRVLEEFTQYIKEAGYTQQDYEKDLQMMGSKEEAQELPGFIVPVEYRVNENGFTASVLCGKIQEMSKHHKLQNVVLLEYFMASGSTLPGYMFVPDGAGAIIRTDEKGNQGLNYVQPLYGEDESIKRTKIEQFTQSALLPVYGLKQEQNAIFAIIESGDGNALIHANTMGKANPLHNIYADFDVRGMDVTDIGAARQLPVFNLFPKHIMKETATIAYTFLSGDNADYSGMAKYYRDTLVKQGVLREPVGDKKALPFYVDLICSITDKIRVLGVPLNKNVVLTRLEDAEKLLEELKNQGVDNAKIRLKGYSPGGLSHYAMSKLQFQQGIGGIKGFRNLVDIAGKLDYKLYLDADIPYVYKNNLWDGFSERKHTARRLDRSIVRYGDFSRVTLKYMKDTNPRYSVSPAVYASLAEGFAASTESVLGTDAPKVGISAGTLGSVLNSDFNAKREYDRSMAKDAIEDAAGILVKSRDGIMTECGNKTVLQQARDILQMPLTSSGFGIESESVPFYPMVIHGFVDYAGFALNLAPDYRMHLLKTIEAGAGLYFTWMTEEDSLLKDTEYERSMYSLHYRKTMEEAASLFNTLNPLLAKVQKEQMVKHAKVGEGLYETVYSNGTVVQVDYNKFTVQVDGKMVDVSNIRDMSGGDGT